MHFPRLKIKRLCSALVPGIASLVIASGWNWYHLPHHPKQQIFWVTLIIATVLWVLYEVGTRIIIVVLKRRQQHLFWINFFAHSFKLIWLIGAFLFLIFFSRHEIINFIFCLIILGILFWKIDKIFQRHSQANKWRKINLLFFAWIIFFLSFNAVCQYLAAHYYILDPGAKYYNVSLFRTISITAFWLGLFSGAFLFFLSTQKRIRYLLVGIFSICFVLFIIIWTINIGILYYSGLNISPTTIMHVNGSGNILYTKTAFFLLLFCLIVLSLFTCCLYLMIKGHISLPARYWRVYHRMIIVGALGVTLGLASFRSIPELAIIKSFYQNLHQQNQIILQPITQEKLKKFGINYQYDNFFLAHKDYAYTTNTPPLLPPPLTQPNIIIIFLESFSSRLTSVYNPTQVPGATPGLELMAHNPNTTIFKKYYNASTPTVTGLISQLCSFLPPTGHNEIEKENRLRSHHLLCLPKILKQNGWQYTGYITAVQKNFAHKDTIFTSMGTDEIFGTEELNNIVQAEPLSWGFSDHQLFPAMEKIITRQQTPYLIMLSTVDTHPPFTIAQDMVHYQNGQNNVLNSVHTTDDAFRIFWNKFILSPVATNTIVIAVADHAIFPTAITKDYFPDATNQVNFYDETTFLIYIPKNILPKEINLYSSGIDFTPTLLHILGINPPNSFEGHSIFDNRAHFPNLIGMHELGLYINESLATGTRQISYSTPSSLNCDSATATDAQAPLTLCEFLNFYQWKRQAFEQGRFWEN